MRLSGADPRLALTRARAVLAEARAGMEAAGREGEPYGEALSVALRASALAARELGDLHLADERLREAVEAGSRFPPRVAQARMSLVAVRTQLGDPEGALRLAELAERHLTGTDLARLDVQRSVALNVLGRHRDAVRHCDRAVDRLGDDPWFQAGGLLNRGVARTYLEEYGAAEADLSECARLARAAGLDHVAMLAEGNLPFVAARRGDIATAFASYEVAEAGMAGYPERLAAMRADFAEALVAARLPGEARAMLEQALPDLTAGGAHAAIPDARLLLAQAQLLAGDAGQAAATAQTALTELLEQGRAASAPLATEVVLRARLAKTSPTPTAAEVAALLPHLLSCAADLDGHGRPGAAAELRLTTARAALLAGHRTVARAQLEVLAEPLARPLVRQHALAMIRRLDGDLSGALESAREGVETLAATRAERDAELRAHTVRPAEDLAAFGLELALETGDGWMVLDWAERYRALARGRAAPVRADPTPFDPFDPRDSRNPAGGIPGNGPGTLIELVRSGDELWGVLVAPASTGGASTGGVRCLLRPLGSYRAAAEATVRIRYGLRRRNLRDLVDRGAGAAPEMMDAELAALGEQLLGPFGLGSFDLGRPDGSGRLADGPVVIVPTGALCTLPWPLLPALAGRPVSVAPDATAWASSKRPPERPPAGPPAGPPGPGKADRPVVVAVAGPGLRHARAEADMVVTTHARAERIEATRREVLATLERADVLHIAAHGMSSPRSPMLSRLTLEDGPLMAYDLLRAGRMPRLVVLSACDAGMAHAPVDGAALGLAGTFLDRGAACVIAGVVPVRDDEALALMTVFHAVLAEGRSPAEALAAAAAKTTVSGFVCFGDPYG
ncbi:CHAT domain-containing protein [Sphaerimonospora thailandensis]|uniref:CHAT domain-containing protein n=1 Tax=Sphaerimonospora thailandensis TaxID=795644 RepID=A0A8J3RD68_9ACTN|nr:CHAT domain-containing protein [Sphaerimonospora thailandensis]